MPPKISPAARRVAIQRCQAPRTQHVCTGCPAWPVPAVHLRLPLPTESSMGVITLPVPRLHLASGAAIPCYPASAALYLRVRGAAIPALPRLASSWSFNRGSLYSFLYFQRTLPCCGCFSFTHTGTRLPLMAESIVQCTGYTGFEGGWPGKYM